MKVEMVGSFTAPKGNAMPEDCTRCHNAEWGNIVVNGVCVKCLVKDNTTIREAGEKMAERLRALQQLSSEYEQRGEDAASAVIFTEQDAAALAKWEAANK